MKTFSSSTANSPARTNHRAYALRRGLGVWDLTFNCRQAALKHEQGLFYVAYLLAHPPEQPLHALALAMRVVPPLRREPGITQLIDPATSNPVTLAADALPVEQNPGMEAAESAWALRRKQNELEAILEAADQSEPVKAEVRRELEEIYEFQKHSPARATDAARKCARSVRMAVTRLHRKLAEARDAEGNPHPVLAAFGEHIHECILVPSARFSGRAGWLARMGLAGSFTYEPPVGVVWER